MATSSAALRKELLRQLREKLLPAVRRDGTKVVILAESSVRAPAEVTVSQLALPPLRISRKSKRYFVLAEWPKIGLTSSRFPIICFVLQGEMDMRVGRITTGSKPKRSVDGQLVTGVKEGMAFITPSGVPHDSANHWWRTEPERANCDIFQMLMLPEGARCHICSTRGTQHTQRGWLLVQDPKLLNLTEMMIDELRSQEQHSAAIAQSFLLAILQSVDRGLDSRAALLAREDLKLDDKDAVRAPSTMPSGSTRQSTPFERACQFIQESLSDELTVAAIASHVSLSPTHLNSLFRAQAGTSVMQYVTRQRMEAASFYLRRSNLPISEVGKLVGHPNASEFSRAFSKSRGISPRSYRAAA